MRCGGQGGRGSLSSSSLCDMATLLCLLSVNIFVLCVVISDSMVFHCNFILGSVCHGSGRHHLSGPSDLSLICIGHRTMALLLIELFLHLIFRVFLSQQTTVRAVTIHLSPPARCFIKDPLYTRPMKRVSLPSVLISSVHTVYCVYGDCTSHATSLFF